MQAGEIRNGNTFDIDGNVYQVLEFQHVKPGKGAAFVRTKLKNVITGGVVEKTFRPTEKLDDAFVERKDMTYSYMDGELYYFMDNETYEQLPVGKDIVGDSLRAAFSQSKHRSLSSLRSRIPSPASRATRPPAHRSPRPSRPARRSTSRCSSTSATSSRSIRVRKSISPASNNTA